MLNSGKREIISNNAKKLFQRVTANIKIYLFQKVEKVYFKLSEVFPSVQKTC